MAEAGERAIRPGSVAGCAARAFELVVLGGLLALVGWQFVPAHGTSIWNDYEFSGWVAPLANRLAAGERLYADGSRSPMPPLPTVGLRLATGGEARWIDESRWNFLLQAAGLLVLYAGIGRVLPRPAAWLAVVTAVPLFFALPKAILYDSLSQFLVAAVVTLALFWAARWRRPDARERWADWLYPAALGALMATLLLSKTSTVAGTAVGAAWLVLAAPAASLGRRLLRLAVYAAASLAALAAWVAVLSPSMSPAGFVEDVLLHGSEPKGGPLLLLGRLAGMLVQLALWLGLAGAGLLFASGFFGRPAAEGSSAGEERGVLPALATYPAALAGWAAAGAYFFVTRGAVTPLDAMFEGGVSAALGLGLFAVVVLGLAASIGVGSKGEPTRVGFVSAAAALGLPGIVALGAALTHSLSVAEFRWTYDNNPLVVLALAAFYLGLLRAPQSSLALPRFARTAALFMAVALVTCGAGLTLNAKLAVTARCTESWPEVDFLAGARLRPEADGMRELVATVRRLASADEAVALLPNDPNVEAWFERPRWKSAAAIVFPDQYWDRYVDADFERLRRAPPRVIVIGPREVWRPFCRHWHRNWGAERLIDRVEKELLPAEYELVTSQPIAYRRGTDFMDVYLRRNK